MRTVTSAIVTDFVGHAETTRTSNTNTTMMTGSLMTMNRRSAVFNPIDKKNLKAGALDRRFSYLNGIVLATLRLSGLRRFWVTTQDRDELLCAV